MKVSVSILAFSTVKNLKILQRAYILNGAFLHRFSMCLKFQYITNHCSKQLTLTKTINTFTISIYGKRSPLSIFRNLNLELTKA